MYPRTLVRQQHDSLRKASAGIGCNTEPILEPMALAADADFEFVDLTLCRQHIPYNSIAFLKPPRPIPTYSAVTVNAKLQVLV